MSMVTRISIVLFDGFDELDAIAPYEVFKAAELAGAPITTKLVGFEPGDRIVTGHGLELKAQGQLGTDCDWVLVPGGSWRDKKPKGAWAEIERGVLPKRLAELWSLKKNMASICTGAMILAAAGITQGRRVITHHVAIDALRASGAIIVPQRVVDDGNLVTAGGVTSGIDLALHLVERFGGAEIAKKGAARMEYQRQPVFSDKRT